MPEVPTPNYGFNKPEPNDSMADFETWLNHNWDAITDAASPPSGTVLPQTGTYKIGDRFYKTDTQSIYILVGKDPNWGWFWRPIQDAISPWFTIPSTCLDIANWTVNPVPANPFAIALDNRGKCYWRGVIGTVSGNIARATSHITFKSIPAGITPREGGIFMLGHETLSVSTTATSLNAWQGARIFLSANLSAQPSIRALGGSADFNRIHLSGINYAVGTELYSTP